MREYFYPQSVCKFIICFLGFFFLTFQTAFGNKTGDVFINLTLQVDMKLEEVHPDGVFISCNILNNFAPTKMDQVSASLWSVTFESPIGYEVLWKYLNGPETYESNTGLDECSINGGFSGVLRTFITGSTDYVLPAVCYGYCNDCDIINSTNNHLSDQNISVFPNPASEKISVNYHFNHPKNLSVKLFNLNGRLIKSQMKRKIKSGILEFDLTGIKEGIYWIDYKFDNQRMCRKLYIKK